VAIAHQPSETALPPTIVLYDGVCGLCNIAVSWLLRHDRDRKLHFAALQGETAARLRKLHREIPEKLDTVVLVDDGRVFVRSKVFLYVARHLRWPWRLGYHVRWLPAPVLDILYRFIARIRYRVWGKYEACRAPSTDDRSRLLP
jgi:predicted DCC family thiol-disulfide oxidoreductase YuxK